VRKPARLAAWLGLLGFGIAGLLFGYLEWTNYARLNPFVIGATIVLCPSSLLSILFIDIEPHSVEAAFAWSFVGVMNAAIYAGAGWMVGTRLFKPTRARS